MTGEEADGPAQQAGPELTDQPLLEAARAGASRLRVLEVLRRAPEGLGIADLADQVGLHMNTVRFHLDRLLAEGLVTRRVEQRAEPGRPRLSFTAVRRPDVGRDQRSYHLLAEMLAGYVASAVPDPVGQSTQLGRTWGRYLATRPAPYRQSTEEEARVELVQVLQRIGFAPQPVDDDAGPQIRLRHCPFLEVADAHREVVCSLHLGLMQGVVAELRAPIDVDRLEPFAEPSACIAYLTASAVPST